MKISNDFLEAIRRQEETQKPKTVSSTGQGFAELMAEEATASQSLSGALGTRLDPAMLLPLSGLEQPNADQDLETTITNQALTLLDSFEGYAKQMASGTSPKSLYSALNGMEGQLSQMRNTLDGMKNPSSSLGGLLNELQVLTTTEKFKLNRGDFS